MFHLPRPLPSSSIRIALTFDDPEHWDEEDREITIGSSSNGRVDGECSHAQHAPA
jgi:hypothetical protein